MMNKILAVCFVVFFIMILVSVCIFFIQYFRASLFHRNYKRPWYFDYLPFNDLRKDYFLKSGQEHIAKASAYGPVFLIGVVGFFITLLLHKVFS